MKKSFSTTEAISFGWRTFKSNWKFWIVAFLIFMVGSGYSANNFSNLGSLATPSGNDYLNKYNNTKYTDYEDTNTNFQYRNLQKGIPSNNLLNLNRVERNVLGVATEIAPSLDGKIPGVVWAIIPFVIVFVVVFLAFIIVMSLVSVIFQMGYINLTLDVARNKQVYYKTLLNQVSFKKALKLLISQIYVGFIVVCGLILFIIPGIIFALQYVFVPYVFVDQEEPSIKEAMKKSRQITKGVKFKLLGFGIVSILVWLAGMFVFGLGVIVSAIVISIAMAYVYKELVDGDSSQSAEVPVPSPEPVVVGEASSSLESLTTPSGL